MTCAGFNADFDGDQMAVHLPLSEKSVEEVKLRMFAKENLLSLRDGTPLFNVSKDMAMGIYFLTLVRDYPEDKVNIYSSLEDLMAAYHLRQIRFDRRQGYFKTERLLKHLQVEHYLMKSCLKITHM